MWEEGEEEEEREACLLTWRGGHRWLEAVAVAASVVVVVRVAAGVAVVAAEVAAVVIVVVALLGLMLEIPLILGGAPSMTLGNRLQLHEREQER